MGENIEQVLNLLGNKTTILIDWFNNDYFMMNMTKCHLLINNQSDNLNNQSSVAVAQEIVLFIDGFLISPHNKISFRKSRDQD